MNMKMTRCEREWSIKASKLLRDYNSRFRHTGVEFHSNIDNNVSSIVFVLFSICSALRQAIEGEQHNSMLLIVLSRNDNIAYDTLLLFNLYIIYYSTTRSI
jgi:hypothetical protein